MTTVFSVFVDLFLKRKICQQFDRDQTEVTLAMKVSFKIARVTITFRRSEKRNSFQLKLRRETHNAELMRLLLDRSNVCYLVCSSKELTR